MSVPDQPRFHYDDLLTVADAARIAKRSVRTIRRAYLSGRLIAHRDGNGRGVRIRYGDLHAWLTARVVTPTGDVPSSRPVPRADVRTQTQARVKTGNLELLNAARRRARWSRPRRAS